MRDQRLHIQLLLLHGPKSDPSGLFIALFKNTYIYIVEITKNLSLHKARDPMYFFLAIQRKKSYNHNHTDISDI